jgi:hypothetical protein
LQGGCFVWRLDSNHVLVLSTCTSHRTDAAWVLYQILENYGVICVGYGVWGERVPSRVYWGVGEWWGLGLDKWRHLRDNLVMVRDWLRPLTVRML